MRNVKVTMAVLLAGIGLTSVGEVSFAKKPTVTREGDRYTIAFAVSAATDVAVYIEDAKGEVVRHLVAGVLGGANPPPAPLRPGLAQEIEWDGKADYGKVAEGGPFKVRVGLGLAAKYDRVAYDGMRELLNANSIAVAPDGKIYARASVWGGGDSQWQIFDRDGTFQGVWDVPPGPEAARYFGWTFEDGRPDPMGFREVKYVSASSAFKAQPGSDAAVVSRDSGDLFQLGSTIPVSIYRYPLTATCPQDDKFSVSMDVGEGRTPVITGTGQRQPQGCLAVSSDGKRLYVGGLWNKGGKTTALAAVYAVKCPERTGCQILFGDPAKPGNDDKSLGGAPAGLAVDGKGRLFIADTANNRVVVVDEKDGNYLGEIATDQPMRIGVSTRTGSVYVLGSVGTGRAATTSLARFTPPAGSAPQTWKSLKPDATMPDGGYLSSYLAVDDSSGKTLLWRRNGEYEGRTLRIADSGSGPDFGAITQFPAGRAGNSRRLRNGPDQVPCGNVQVDRLRKEIYFRNGVNGLHNGRFIEKTGDLELFEVQYPGYMQSGGTGLQIVPGRNGNLYGIAWGIYLFQYDRNGKSLTWEDATYNDPLWVTEVEKFRAKGSEHSGPGPGQAYVPVSMSMLPHMLGTRWSDGHIFVFHPRTAAGGARCLKAMHEYLPSGREVTAPDNFTIWKVTDAATGPKFDAAGNIYVAEAVRPKGWLMPRELADYYTGKGVALEPQDNRYRGPVGGAVGLYGSIIKFSPKGGMVDLPPKKGEWGLYADCQEPYIGQPKLDPGLGAIDVDVLTANIRPGRPCRVIGAEWIHPGVGHMGMYNCNCESVTFDVDEFGRVFFPDTPQFKVRVIDTAGNSITQFGDFGGANCMGPESPVVDARTDRLRPRREDDPQNLNSPFSEPEIAFKWLNGIGVTDRYAYCGDSLNQRLLRTRLVYAVEVSCALP